MTSHTACTLVPYNILMSADSKYVSVLDIKLPSIPYLVFDPEWSDFRFMLYFRNIGFRN